MTYMVEKYLKIELGPVNPDHHEHKKLTKLTFHNIFAKIVKAQILTEMRSIERDKQ